MFADIGLCVCVCVHVCACVHSALDYSPELDKIIVGTINCDMSELTPSAQVCDTHTYTHPIAHTQSEHLTKCAPSNMYAAY